MCFVQNVGHFSIKTAVEAEARETNSEDEVDGEYLPDDGHTHGVSNHDASHELSDSDDPDYIPSETNSEDEVDNEYSEDEVDNEYLSADGHTHDVSNYDDPAVAQKRCVKTASVQEPQVQIRCCTPGCLSDI